MTGPLDFFEIRRRASRQIRRPQDDLRSLTQIAKHPQDLQFLTNIHTFSIRNRPAKQVKWSMLDEPTFIEQETRLVYTVLCAVSASPECLRNRGGSPPS